MLWKIQGGEKAQIRRRHGSFAFVVLVVSNACVPLPLLSEARETNSKSDFCEQHLEKASGRSGRLEGQGFLREACLFEGDATQFLQHLAETFPHTFDLAIFGYHSDSVQPSSFEEPRVIVYPLHSGWDDDRYRPHSVEPSSLGGGFFFAFSTSLEGEVLSVRPRIELIDTRVAGEFSFSEMIFSGSGLEEIDPEPDSCAVCHNGRLLFNPYRTWPGFFGSNDDKPHGQEREALEKLEKTIGASLPYLRRGLLAVMNPKIDVGANRPLLQFARLIHRANGKRFKRRHQQKLNSLQKVAKYVTFCNASQEVLAELDKLGPAVSDLTEQHTESLKSDIAELSGAQNGLIGGGHHSLTSAEAGNTFFAYFHSFGLNLAELLPHNRSKSFAIGDGTSFLNHKTTTEYLFGRWMNEDICSANTEEILGVINDELAEIELLEANDKHLVLPGQAVVARCDSCHGDPETKEYIPFSRGSKLRQALREDPDLLNRTLIRLNHSDPQKRMPPSPWARLSKQEQSDFEAVLRRIAEGN